MNIANAVDRFTRQLAANGRLQSNRNRDKVFLVKRAPSSITVPGRL